MDLHLFVNRERKNLYLARQISARQISAPHGAVMAFITDRNYYFSLPQYIRFPLNGFELATKVIVGLYFSNGKISYNIYMY